MSRPLPNELFNVHEICIPLTHHALRITHFMKTLCFCNTNTAWGGGEKWHSDLAIRLQERGYPVRAITNAQSQLSQKFRVAGIPCCHAAINNLSFLNLFKIFRLARFLKEARIHTIILNLSNDVKVAGIAAKLAGVPKIIYRRGLAKPVKNSLLNRFLFRHIITDVIVNSEDTRNTMLRYNPDLIPQEHIRIIYNGIDLQAHDQQPVNPLYERQPGEILLGNAARFTPQKGQKYLIELAQRLKAQGIAFRLLLAGKGELEEELQQYARTLQVEDEVIFAGFQENIKSFTENIDIFLLSSLFEGFGYVLVEAMASRKPVVAFHTSSNPEIVAHGETGFLAETGNIKDMLEYVKHLTENQALRRRFGENGRRRVETLFDIHRTVEQTIEFINQ